MTTAPDLARLKLIIESVLFVADGPVDLRTLSKLTEATPEAISQAVQDLAAANRDRGVRIQASGQAVQMVSAPETAPYVQRYLGIDEHQRLTPVVLVTLTVIAYRQPITKGEVERILNKSCDYSVEMLKARELITEVGRTDGPGRPYLYGTTFKFLEHFGLEKPEDLPPLPELEVAATAAPMAAVAEDPDGEEPADGIAPEGFDLQVPPDDAAEAEEPSETGLLEDETSPSEPAAEEAL